MSATIQISGLKELERMLTQHLPKSTGKAVLRRVGKASLKPVIEAAKGGVPVDDGDLRDSLKVTTQLSRRQKAAQRKIVAQGGGAAVMLFAGAAALPHAHLQEFGTAHHAPQPFMRPAWDAKKEGVLRYITTELGQEIEKTIARYRKRMAKSQGAA